MDNVYYININDDDCFMNAISLVEYPAVEKDFLVFDKQSKMNMQFADDDQHIITGVVCLADTPIYRYDRSRGEYYVVFTKEVIKQMVLKYSKMNLFNSVNLDHDDNKFVDSVYMVEAYIKDTEKGISPAHFEDVPEGSLFMSYKVTDDDLWNEIKNGNHFNGFSLQITADLEKKDDKYSKDNKDDNEVIDEFVNSLLA